MHLGRRWMNRARRWLARRPSTTVGAVEELRVVDRTAVQVVGDPEVADAFLAPTDEPGLPRRRWASGLEDPWRVRRLGDLREVVGGSAEHGLPPDLVPGIAPAAEPALRVRVDHRFGE